MNKDEKRGKRSIFETFGVDSLKCHTVLRVYLVFVYLMHGTLCSERALCDHI